MDSEKPFQTLTVDGYAQGFANFDNAERHARAIVRHLRPIEIWQGGNIIALVFADRLKRTRMKMYG